MRVFPELRNFLFRLRHGFRGVPLRINGMSVRLDESLRRWNVAGEAQVQNILCEILRPGDGFLDVGANFGLHTLLAGRLVTDAGEVHAFEPLPSNLRLLRRHVRLNRLEDVVRVVPAVVSDSDSREVAFYSGAETIGVTASLVSSGGNTTQFTVANRRLDDYLKNIKQPIRLLKIDVEGAELKVLRGAGKFITAHRPTLVIEVHAFAFADFGYTLGEFRDFLTDAGYAEEILPDTILRNGLHYQARYNPK